MKGIIDRFVGDYAVVEFTGSRMVEILKRDLPAGLKVGDAIQCTEGAYVLDELENERIKNSKKSTLGKL
jgi:hypothetical protein